MFEPDTSGESGSPAYRPLPLTLDQYAEGVLAGDRTTLARAITLIESNLPEHVKTARQLLTRLMPHTGDALRLGITGVPGAGKSTFIETLGIRLTGQGHRLAVLAIDPSSTVSGGSILGDKTRMELLARDENAFIRPSPTAAALGGVARKTRETMLLCEAAGFDIVIVETVGVGQSETVVADMTDFFLVLMLPGAGDELQGIKRGLLELVDMIAVNKADGDNLEAARRSARDYRNACHFMRPAEDGWQVPVQTVSARTGAGVDQVWKTIFARYESLKQSGALREKRSGQMLRWLQALVDEGLRSLLQQHAPSRAVLDEVRVKVRSGELPPTTAADMVLETFRKH
ncbi:MAG TPA: methylmalonyl Co-A mutase-associated GTPase MeaB [Phycisphaeraceae bacterium]|nr:methylmalonyl Co-A mutase-associated GTPase MeaB [Phycisphaeraceae bacterium]